MEQALSPSRQDALLAHRPLPAEPPQARRARLRLAVRFVLKKSLLDPFELSQ